VPGWSHRQTKNARICGHFHSGNLEALVEHLEHAPNPLKQFVHPGRDYLSEQHQQ